MGIFQRLLHKKSHEIQEKEAGEGYDLWAKNYDRQPGNLMLDFDEQVFLAFLQQTEIKGSIVADVGCGTGRHWPKILARQPSTLQGFDVSKGMLLQLKEKYPMAAVSHIKDDCFEGVKDASFDLVISTLTIAHIRDVREALRHWCRILKPTGEMIITDFHPFALMRGGKRTFRNKDGLLSIINYVHPIETIREICLDYGLAIVAIEERVIDETVKPFYQQQHAMHVYKQFKGVPMLYGIYLKHINDIK